MNNFCYNVVFFENKLINDIKQTVDQKRKKNMEVYTKKATKSTWELNKNTNKYLVMCVNIACTSISLCNQSNENDNNLNWNDCLIARCLRIFRDIVKLFKFDLMDFSIRKWTRERLMQSFIQSIYDEHPVSACFFPRIFLFLPIALSLCLWQCSHLKFIVVGIEKCKKYTVRDFFIISSSLNEIKCNDVRIKSIYELWHMLYTIVIFSYFLFYCIITIIIYF